ncbi:MAG TPA: hypothetical protein VN611_11490 [Patescibacteria group bacterium]|nr:hypothetical protein [Patescibacteria group bacterium]
MNKKILCGLIAGIIVAALSGCSDSKQDAGGAPAPAPTQQKQAAAPAANPAPQVNTDYSRYLSVEEVQGITGKPNLSLKSIDAKKSGEANDLTYSTADGKVIMTVQVLRGNDYDMYYNNLRSQDYKGIFEQAFWGPRQANPPELLGFRKGDTLIVISTKLNGKIPYLDTDMMAKAAKLIASRL